MIEITIVAMFFTVVIVMVSMGWFSGYPPASAEVPALNKKEQAVIQAAANAMFPRGGVLPISGSEAGVLRYFNETLVTSPRQIRLLLRLLLVLTEHGPWLINLRPRLTKQAPEQRVETLRSWAEHPVYFLRVAFTSLRTLISFAYLSDVRVVQKIGATPNRDPFGGRSVVAE